MSKGTISFEIQCAKCGSTVVEMPDDTSDDPVIHCANGHALGPYSSLQAAMRGEARTSINAVLTDITFKQVKR